ncbi:DNA translocase SftA [Lysinibacillus sphaericus]|uniref:DNA translocase SftA n=1 Tax=Lysinibacillus sphaericus TaxID=1421 RepID=A0A2S5CWV7_LYSSH|nr:DNA translocase SftA [Lysinibacillus sphaericus]
MNWFKRKLDKILNRDDYEYEEYYEEYEEQPEHQQPIKETQAPTQKAFRFPLIDDEPEIAQPSSQSKEMFNQMDDVYGQIEDLSLPKHLNHQVVDSRVYDIEVSGIRDLLENRSKRTGRTTISRVQPKQEYPTKASMVFRDAQIEAAPVLKEPQAKQENTVESTPQNRKRFVPTDVPSPVYGFAKPSPIEQLLNKRKEEHEAEKPSIAMIAKEATTNKPIENILEEKEPTITPNDLHEQLEISSLKEVPKHSSGFEDVEVTEHSQAIIDANGKATSKQPIIFEEVEVTESSKVAFEANTDAIPKQPITFEEVAITEQSELTDKAEKELPIPQTTSFAVNFEAQIKDAVQQELAVEQLSADQSEIHVKEVVVEQLQIENSTIHIGEVTVVQPSNEENEQQVVEESSVKQEKSRIPFNVLMLKTDKEKWRISQQLKSKVPATTEKIQNEIAVTSDDDKIDDGALSEHVTTSSIETSSQEPFAKMTQSNNNPVITMSPVATMTRMPTEKQSSEADTLEVKPVSPIVTNEIRQAEQSASEADNLEGNLVSPIITNEIRQAEQLAIEVDTLEENPVSPIIPNEMRQAEQPASEADNLEGNLVSPIITNEIQQAEQTVIEVDTLEENLTPSFVANDLHQAEQTAITVDANEEISATLLVGTDLLHEKTIQKSNDNQNIIEEKLNDTLEILNIEPEKEIKPQKPIHVYQKPTDEFLEPPEEKTQDTEWMEQQGDTLVEALSYFQVSAQIESIMQGPAVTQFEITVSHGTKVSKIRNLADDLKLALAAKDIRIQAPIPGKSSIGIEIPNRVSRAVRLSEVTNSASFLDSDSPLEAALGLDLTGKPVTIDLRKMPHGLIAGATGSGKSVCINSILVSLLYKAAPHELKLMLIDPKMVELAPFNHIPHLVSPVITDVKAATAALKWAVEEMERRYQLFAHAGARDITRYNALADKNNEHSLKLPYILIVIDELADLMMMSPADVEEAICRIAQKARACGIHLIVATQRPSVDVITGLIKSNIPTRIAFAVSSQIDSRTILDGQGAERLLGRGDMLYLGNGMSAPVRLQGTFVTDDEIEAIIDHVREQGEPDYIFDQEELLKKSEVTAEQDDLFEDVCRFVYEAGGASTSLIQRKYHIGYNRAARLIDMLESHGFVSEARGSKPRESYITEQDLIAMFE